MICDETTSISQTLVVLSAKPHGFMIYLWKKIGSTVRKITGKSK